MIRALVHFASGLLFAVGLCLSGMTQPQKVLGFLDVTGRWDPSLAFVMVGAIGVTAVAFRLSARRAAPALSERFHLPDTRGGIDRRLIAGAALFGAGWGLSGLCPGPAVVAVASGQLGVIAFVAAMLAGMALHRLAEERWPEPAREAPSVSSPDWRSDPAAF